MGEEVRARDGGHTWNPHGNWYSAQVDSVVVLDDGTWAVRTDGALAVWDGTCGRMLELLSRGLEEGGPKVFIQVLQGSTSDAEGLRARLDGWVEEHGSSAVGWLGTTAGVTADGVFVAAVRFADEAAARQNSDRPEQGEWWAGTEPLFDGPVTFHDYRNCDLLLGGGSDAAGFVQVIQGTYTGDGTPAMPADDAAALSAARPEVIGGSIGWDDNGHFTQIVYFTSEEEARRGEQAMGEDPEARARLERFMADLADVEYFDLSEPWLA